MNSYQKVTQLFKKTAYALNRIIVGRDTLWATPEHKFFIAAKGWVQAAGLTAGMLMQSQVGTSAINSNVAIDTVAVVYNFTVENNHTYYVGKENLLTHNKCSDIADLIKSGKLDAKYADDFEKQFGNTPLFKKFVDGDLDVRAWEAILKKIPAYHLSVRTTYLKIIQNGGNAVLQQDGTIKLFSKNRQFAILVNGKITPIIGEPKRVNFWKNSEHGVGTVPLGDRMNGNRVYQKGDDFVIKREPDLSPYTANERALVTDHPDAHGADRHFPDVTDEACIDRARTGVTPDGVPGTKTFSSKFETPDQVKLALANTMPGTAPFIAGITDANTGLLKVEHTLPAGSFYGKGVEINGNTFIPCNKVVVYYQEISPNNWKIKSIYPSK